MNGKVYTNAPITEAVIDIHFETSNPLSFDKLESLKTLFVSEFPKIDRHRQVGLTVQPGLDVKQAVKDVGIRLTSADGKRVLQLRPDGFTFSRLKPYESWTPFRDEAKKLWNKYSESSNPEHVIRTAVRFINRFDLPTASVKLGDYFTIFPQTPEFIVMNSLVMQVVIPDNTKGNQLIVNQAVVPGPSTGGVSVLLDLDLYNQNRISKNEVWDSLEEMHTKKNFYFESFITDMARELIK